MPEKSIQEKYNMGQPILIKLGELKKDELIEAIKKICSGDSAALEVLENNPSVVKIISDDVISEININWYDKINISPFGINYKPEHGGGRTIVNFNETFTLDNILK